jgi:hypothetical protein
MRIALQPLTGFSKARIFIRAFVFRVAGLGKRSVIGSLMLGSGETA